MPDPNVPRSRRDRARLGWVVLFSLLSLIPIAVWNTSQAPNTPSKLVGAFLEAVREGDLEQAMGYTETTFPTGEEATFLHPDAAEDDWEILELTEHEGEYSSETDVTATIGHPGGTAVGHFTVSESFDDELILSDPLIQVNFTPSSQLTVQIGDRTAERDTTAILNTLVGQAWTYYLLPGIYRFYDGEPTAVLEPYREDETITVDPPRPEPTPEQVVAVQSQVNDLIDGCLEYRLHAPPGCPFSTDGEVDTPEGLRLTQIEDAEWVVDEYPEATVTPADPELVGDNLLQVEFTDPGRLQLHGKGTEDYDEWVEFTTPCHFVGDELLVLLHGQDQVELTPLGAAETDSCRGTA